MTAYERVFAAVFPPVADVDLPTPAATPVLGSSSFGEAFGSPLPQETTPVTGAAEQIKWNRAWHTATTYLTLPSDHITATHVKQDEQTLRGKWVKPFTAEISRAVTYIVSGDSYGRQLRKGAKKDNLLQWYFEAVGSRHYLEYVRPGLIKVLKQEENLNALFEVIQVLQVAQAIYLHPLRTHIIQLLPNGGKEELIHIREDLHGLFAYSLNQEGFVGHLSHFLRRKAFTILGVDGTEDGSASSQEERPKTLKFMQSLQDVGLGGSKAQRVFAEVMSETLTEHIRCAYAGQWSSPSTIIEQLRYWVENRFARLAVEVLACLKEEDGASAQLTKVTHSDVQKWQDMAINKLGILRTGELFNIIVEWDNGSRGGVEDLKRYVTNTDSRTHLTSSFINVLSHRLLQPGASTTEILQMYISIIRAFTILDPKGVLLDRVARPIRRYLHERDDTVTIVVGGLLADPEDEFVSADILLELAVEMNKPSSLTGEDEIDDAELDWDDMSWMPDPVDAGPEYKKSKNSDVIGSLISLFDSKDVFVKEFQNILGERLLKKEYDFDKEIRVLELLKLRFGEAALQACEVMLRDILDSRRVDTVIRNDQKLNRNPSNQRRPELHTRILSHLFWPSLRSETFFIPPEVASMQSRYATGFEALKQSRKLTWLHALGQVIVNLDLTDRTITEEVQTWQASVIYAFQESSSPPHPSPSSPITKTVPQLMHDLSMSEALVRNALTFWTGKLVLRETAPDAFQVLETLSSSDDADADGVTQAAAAADAAIAVAPAPAVLADEAASKEKMAVFWQYVVAMLTNRGPLPLQQIVAFLGVFVPGGFPFGNEVMKEFLDGMVEEGRLEVAGGNYKIVH